MEHQLKTYIFYHNTIKKSSRGGVFFMQCKKCKKTIEDDSIYCRFCGKKQISEPKKELKKPNGYGSVIKLGGRRKKPWAVRVTDAIVDGKQIFRYISYHETKTEALKALALEQICPTSPKANITLNELFDEWTETAKFKNISKQTRDNYTAAYKHLNSIKNVKFTDLRTSHFQKIIDELDRSKSTKSKIKILISLLYKYAMQNDICNKNYADFILLDKEERQEKEIFTDIEIQKFWDNESMPYVDTILIMIYSGMRISEMLELTKFNIDFDNNTITGGLKTDAGKNRIIPIHPKILRFIKKYYENATDKLFIKDDGMPLLTNYYRKYIYYPILEKLELPKRTPHCCRHTFATLMSRNHVDTLAIQQIIGHSDYAFTADVYTHSDIAFLKEAINKI
jgi:integrase|nr:MAG TPA_asm: Integrase [Caudoviricetes sp.]